MNQMTTSSGNAVAALSKLKTGLAGVAATLPKAGGDPILRLLKDGTWVYGQENIEVEPDSEWALNPFSLMHGFVSWTRYQDVDKNDKRKDELVGQKMVPFFEPQPSRGDLPNTGWDWTEQVSVNIKCLTGEDTGTQIVYSPTSVGGIGAMRKLIDAIMRQLDIDEAHPVPLVVFGVDSYNHKRYGKTYVPDIQIVGWASIENPEDQTDAAAKDDEPPSEPTDKPVMDRTATGQRQADEQPETGAAVRRRRPAQEQAAASSSQPEQGQPVRRRRAI
jgi:hypothetical protein